jgi:AcrR family transcriptional regulator
MNDAPGRRPYTLRRRAQRQAQTRTRILEAVIARYALVGPARTTVSSVAEGAGVERLTVYRHLPDEAAMVTAAVEHLLDGNPVPDMTAWFGERNPRARLRRGLVELFAFYRAGGPALRNLLAEAGSNAAIAEALDGVVRPLGELPAVLGEGWPTLGARGRERLRASIRHALGVETWRSLTMDGGLDDTEAAELLARLAAAAAQDDD